MSVRNADLGIFNAVSSRGDINHPTCFVIGLKRWTYNDLRTIFDGHIDTMQQLNLAAHIKHQVSRLNVRLTTFTHFRTLIAVMPCVDQYFNEQCWYNLVGIDTAFVPFDCDDLKRSASRTSNPDTTLVIYSLITGKLIGNPVGTMRVSRQLMHLITASGIKFDVNFIPVDVM